MKNKGAILIEIIISIVLFSLFLFPLIDFNNQIFNINLKLLILEEEYTNFNFLRKQLRVKKIEDIRSNVGRHEYFFSNDKIVGDNFLDDIIFPYKADRKTKIIIDIYLVEIASSLETYEYFTIKTMYIVNNKIIESREIRSRLGENYGI